MPLPISDLIVADVVATLGRVTRVGGYDNDLDVRRIEQRPEALTDGMCVVGGADPIPQPDPPCGFQEFNLPVGITCFVIEDEASHVSPESRLYSVAADVRKALLADVHRGGLAVLCEFEQADECHPDNQPPAVVLYLSVRYRHLYGNPYQQS